MRYAQTHLAGDQVQFQGIVDLLYSNISVRFSGGKYIDHWVSGQYDPEFGTHGKDDGFIQPGDRLIPFRQIVSYDEDEAGGWEQDYEIEGSTVLNFTAPPLFALEPGPVAGLEFLVVHDAQDNIGLYDTSGNAVPIVR
jgi:hypothetical protein